MSATYDVSLIHRGTPMLLAAVIRLLSTGNVQQPTRQTPSIAIVCSEVTLPTLQETFLPRSWGPRP